MKHSILIRKAQAVLPDGIKLCDVLLSEGKIAAIGTDLPCKDHHIIDGEGLYLRNLMEQRSSYS